MYLQYMAYNGIHSTSVKSVPWTKEVVILWKKRWGMRVDIGDLKLKRCGDYVRWLAGVGSSFWIVTEDNEGKLWQRFLRTWYLAKLSEYEFVVMLRKYFLNSVLNLVFNFKIQV